eukprot:14663534-Alexandrium_andersonii.AAC.1
MLPRPLSAAASSWVSRNVCIAWFVLQCLPPPQSDEHSGAVFVRLRRGEAMARIRCTAIPNYPN